MRWVFGKREFSLTSPLNLTNKLPTFLGVQPREGCGEKAKNLAYARLASHRIATIIELAFALLWWTGAQERAEWQAMVAATRPRTSRSSSRPQRVSSEEQVQYHDVCPGSPCVLYRGGRFTPFTVLSQCCKRQHVS
jgi:hypothetical protein